MDKPVQVSTSRMTERAGAACGYNTHTLEANTGQGTETSVQNVLTVGGSQ